MVRGLKMSCRMKIRGLCLQRHTQTRSSNVLVCYSLLNPHLNSTAAHHHKPHARNSADAAKSKKKTFRTVLSCRSALVLVDQPPLVTVRSFKTVVVEHHSRISCGAHARPRTSFVRPLYATLEDGVTEGRRIGFITSDKEEVGYIQA